MAIDAAFRKNMMDLRNKKVTVIGLGNSGLGSALLLDAEGAIVSVTESADTEDTRKRAAILRRRYLDVEIGAHTEGFIRGAELFVVSPGVEPASLPMRYAAGNNIPVISELELGFNYCRAKIVAITGTNGKSTVSRLLGDILSRAKIPVNVCGNIGNSLSGELAGVAQVSSGQPGIGKDTVVVLETSSFQLERTVDFKPWISVILNVAEDHLDRHDSFEDYVEAKKLIFKRQGKTDTAIFNYDDEILRKISRDETVKPKVLYYSRRTKVEGAYLRDNSVMTFLKNKPGRVFSLDRARLPGKHNQENILAASLVATLLGADKKSIEDAVNAFSALGHRFQRVAGIKGIDFIDDSKATNVDATQRALESVRPGVILIAGGKDKNLDYSRILPLAKKKVKKFILIGEAAAKLEKIFSGTAALERHGTMRSAVRAAYKSAAPGDTVLLSPMCSSFDMFTDYRHRGRAFREAVEELGPVTL